MVTKKAGVTQGSTETTKVVRKLHKSGEATVHIFEKIGEKVCGTYTGNFDYIDNFGKSKRGYKIRTETGMITVFQVGNLRTRMDEAVIGGHVEITYKGTVKSKKVGQNPMNDFDVEYEIPEKTDGVPF